MFTNSFVGFLRTLSIDIQYQGCHGIWKKGNFLIKSEKTLKIQGIKFKKHRSQGKVRECFCIICVFQ